MLLTILLLTIGILFLVKGADFVVDHATVLGKSLQLPEVLIGIFVVAVGTSLPELIVSALASFQGNPEIAVSNIIGSNIANIGLVIGLASVLGTVSLTRKTVDFDIPISILPLGVLVFGLILNVTLALYVGVLLLLAYIGYLMFSAREYTPQLVTNAKQKVSVGNLLMLIAGLMMLFVGADLTLSSAETVAQAFHLSNMFVGSILIALGTSLPELVTTVVAVIKKEGELAIGNVLGSNVFNMLTVLGVSAIIHPVMVGNLIYEIVFLGLISFVFLIVAKTGKKYAIVKHEGVMLLMTYGIYVLAMFTVR